MNILNKFKSIFKDKNKEQTHDERIGYLANELIKELKASGRSVALPHISKGYGSVDICIQNLGTENEYISVESIINDWEIKAKPTFDKF